MENLLPSLPEWLLIPLIAVIALFTAWPKINQLFQDVNVSKKRYERRKNDLEILKLRYEIEVLKKTNQLDDLCEENKIKEEISSGEFTGGQVVPTRMRFLYGALGSLTPIALRLLTQILKGTMDMVVDSGFVFGILVYFIIGGLVTIFAMRARGTAFMCFLVGLSIPLLLQMIA